MSAPVATGDPRQLLDPSADRLPANDVFLANLSFSQLGLACREKIGSSAWIVDQGCKPMSYFPERHLVDWLAFRGEDATMIGFEKTGVQPLRQS